MTKETTYRVEADPDSPLDQYVVKVTVVDPDDVDIEIDEDGLLVITPKEVDDDDDETHNDKYRLEPEGDMFRIISTRAIPNAGVYQAGWRGGLVAESGILSHTGDCWIDHRSTVRSGWSVGGNACIVNSTLASGKGSVYGNAKLMHVTVDDKCSSYISIAGGSLNHVTIDGDGSLTIDVGAELRDTTIHAKYGREFTISGCLVDGGELHHRNEVVSVYTRWGWLSAFRDTDGDLAIAVGCQRNSNWEDFRYFACDYYQDEEKAMLEGFIAMVTAAQATWTKSAAQIEAEEVAAQAAAAAAQAQKVSPFKDLADAARAATDMPLRAAGPDETGEDEPRRVNPLYYS